MTNIPFDDAEIRKLRGLLDISPNRQPTADDILTALTDAMKTRKAAGQSLSLSRSGRRQIRGNPLLIDARRRAVEAVTKES
jgi:hypothetical protein